MLDHIFRSSRLLLWLTLALTNVFGFSPASIVSLTTTTRHTITSQRSMNNDDNSPWTDGGTISVKVGKELPSTVTNLEALDAWREHHWSKGGGLPIFIVNEENEDPNPKRSILPVFMEESLTDISKQNDDETTTISYHVSKPGPFFPDLVENSHRGTVTFSSESKNTMSWEVEFATTRFRRLYQAVTEFTIGVAARTVQEAVQPSRLLTVKSTLTGTEDSSVDPIVHARLEWMEFFWARGGGLPLPPPIPYGKVLPEGGGTARTSILRVPPLLIDSVLSTSYTPNERADVYYQIKNPGWTTFPFLIHTHLGRVQFLKSSNNDKDVDIIWQIEVRPFPLSAPLVEKLLEMTASTIVRNLAVHMSEPGATVTLKPPRGNANLAGGISSFGSVPKASWLGGVLDSHMNDQRSTVDQTLSLFQPWTWGRSGTGDETDNVVLGWSNGEIQE